MELNGAGQSAPPKKAWPFPMAAITCHVTKSIVEYAPSSGETKNSAGANAKLINPSAKFVSMKCFRLFLLLSAATLHPASRISTSKMIICVLRGVSRPVQLRG